MGFNNTFFGRKITQLLCAGIFVFVFSVLFSGHAEAASRYWIGNGSNTSWNNTANWSTTSGGAGGSSVPGSADTAFFDGGGTGSLTMDATVNVLGINIAAAYTGTITQGSGIAVTVGTGAWTQAGGTFTSTSSAGTAITVNGNWQLSGGTFTSTSGTLTIGTATAVNSYFAASSTPTATFTHNSGTVQMNCYYSKTCTVDMGNQTFNNLSLVNSSGTSSTAANTTFSITGTLAVAGNLTLDQADTTYYNDTDSIIGGTITVAGNYIMNAPGVTSDTGTIAFNGSGAQSITVGSGITANSFGANLANVTVNKSAGTLSLGTAYAYSMRNLTLTAGTFSVGSATSLTATGYTQAGGAFSASTVPITINGNYMQSGGTFTGSSGGTAITVNGNWQLSGGTFTSTSGTLTIGTATAVNSYFAASSTPTATFTHNSGTVQMNCYYNKTCTVDMGNQTLNNISLKNSTGPAGSAVYNTTFSVTGTPTIAGNLTFDQGDVMYFNDTVTVSGAFTVGGNLVGNANAAGAGTITFNGAGTQTVSGTYLKFPTGNVTINKASGSVVLGTALTLPGTAQTLTVTSGTLDLAGNNLTATSTVASAGTLQLQGGETVAAPTTLNAGSTVIYNGTVGPYTLKNYSYSNLTVNGAGATFSPGANVTVGGNLTVSAGTLDLGAYTADRSTAGGTLSLASGTTLKIGGTGTFPANYTTNTLDPASTVEYNSASAQTIVAQSYGNLTSSSTGTRTLASSGTIGIAGNFTAGTNTYTVTGSTVSINGTGAQTITGGTFNNLTIAKSAGTATATGNITAAALTVNGSGGTLNLGTGLTHTISGTVTLTAGTLDGGSSALNVGGDFTNGGGTLTASTGTVAFTNNTLNSTQTISGSNTFNNLTKSAIATTTLAFTAGTTQTVSGTMTLTGTDVANGLLLRSTTPGSAWSITPNGTRTITWLDVKDSNNTLSANKIDCTGLSCTDSGNNTNWIFGQAGEFNPDYPTTGDGGVSASTTTDITNANWGKVPVIYDIKDVNAGVNPAGTVIPSFEYSTNNGTTWTSIVNSRELDSSATSTQNLISKTVYYPHYATWTASSTVSGIYSAQGRVRVTIADADTPSNRSVAATSTQFIIDTVAPTATGSPLLINGSNSTSVTSNTVSVTISSGLSDNSQVRLQLSNDGTTWYGANADMTVSGIAGTYGTATTTGTTLGPWTWTLAGSSRTRTLYARATDVYNNVISSNMTATAVQNASPVPTVTNAPSEGQVGSASPGVITTTFTVTDADSTNTPADTTATTTLMYDVGITASGAISSTSATSITVAGSNNTVIGANDIIQIDTEMMLVSSNSSGTLTVTRGYGGTTSATHANAAAVWVMAKTPAGSICTNASFRAGTCTPVTNASGPFTATWTPASDVSVYYATAKVRITANDGRTVNQVGTGDSGGFELDSAKPVNASPALTFDAGVGGQANSATISINNPTDATTTQYFITDGMGTSTAWTTISGAGPTVLPWTFDSAVSVKTVNVKFRDVYNNEQTATTTISTLNPPATAAFLVQDVSKVSTSDWKEYIGWEAATSTSFASYKLEYATSTNNTVYGTYADVTVITDKTVNYFVHSGLNTNWYYRYRVGVKDINGNTTVRSNAYINAKPDGIQNFGEGGGGTSPSASVVANIVPTENTDGTVTVSYNLKDSSLSTKTNPLYEAYVLYDIGATLTSSSTATLILSDTTKLPASGYVQINQEVIGYTGNNTGTGTLSGITRGTWPTYLSSGRTTRLNTAMLAGAPIWVVATSTATTIANTSISTGQSGSISWATSNDTNLASTYNTNVGIRVLVHDNQSSSAAPLSTQNDLSDSGLLPILDLHAPVLTSTSLLINGSSSSVQASSTSATLSLTGITGDTSSESIQIQFATSTPAVWRGANSDGTLNMIANSWGTATSTASTLGSWSWPLSGRSETITVRVKDAYGNTSNTASNSNQKNAVPEFNGTQTDADPVGYATSTNSNIVIRQCDVFDTDPLCTTGKVKVKFQVRDADTAQGTVTPGYVTALFAASLNGGAYATSTIATYSNGIADATPGKSTVNADGTTFTTVTAYYDPGLSSSATLAARIAVTDSEPGTVLQYATSNTINYDKVNPSGSLTFDAGTAGTAGSATLTVPVPTDATTTQYMISATSTSGTLVTYGWTTLTSQALIAHGFDSSIDSKTVSFRFRDMFGNTSATSSVSSSLPPLASSVSIQDISNASAGTWRTFISWEASTSSSFSLYRLEYATSTDNTTYSAFSDLITIPTASTNYYMHSGSNTVYYRYRLSAKNSAGNYSVRSNAYWTAKPDGTKNFDEASANDTTPPAINTVAVPSIKATAATVTFNSTDNASLVMNDAVYWATQTDFTNNVTAAKTGRDKYVNKFGNPGYVTVGSVGATAAHSVAITGLLKNQAYRYGVESCDATGNCTFEDASGAGYAFTTLNGPAIIGGSVVPTPSFDSAFITWKTDKPSDSEVFYATSSAAMGINPVTVGSTAQVTTPDGNGQYVHTATISGLTYNATYYYKVRSVDQNSSSASYTQYDESAVLNFTTTTQSPPTITVAPACTTTDSTAIVSWTTDQVSTTEISVLTSNIPSNYFSTTAGAQLAQYPLGPTTLIDDAARLSFDYVTSHSNTFTGLTESTTYYVQVRSLNHSGGQASATLTCATPAKQVTIIARPATITDTTPPIISSVIIKDIKGTSVTISWTTDELADSLVKYGTTSNYGSLNGSEELSSDHLVTLSGLTPQTTYNFKLTSADAYGNRAYTGDQTFTTLTLGDEAITTKEQLQALQKELQDLKDQAASESKKSKSLAEAVARFKEILKSVSSDVSLQDLESLTTDITDTITDITQQVTPPTILGGVPQVEVESNKATVTWRTNKTSNSIIALVSQDEYDAKAKDPYTLQVGQPQDDVNNHVVVIPNLQAATVYHFQIRSKAKVGPEGRSKDFTFETKPELPVILDYSFKNISEKSITVTWKTNVVSTSQIKYTPFVNGQLDQKQSKTEGKPDFTTTHEVTTTNMTPDTNFQIEISSADISGGVASKIIGTIKTTVDVVPPVISKVRSESTLFPGKVEKTQTIIYWETDEPSTSQIFWKEGVAKGDMTSSSRLDKELTTNHVVVLTSFTPGSVYRFEVESVDASGNKARSSDYTLLTSKQGQTVIDLIINNFQDIFGFLQKL